MNFFRRADLGLRVLPAVALSLSAWATAPASAVIAEPLASASPVPSIAPVPLRLAASAADMERMTRMLDELDRQELETLVRKARACTRSGDFSCSDRFLGRAGKLAHNQADRELVAAARADLGRTRELQAREEELARLQREEEERLEREEEERERQEYAERRAREEEERRQTRAELFADLSGKMQEIGRVYAESGRQVAEAQALAAQINRERQAEANRAYERRRAEQEEASRRRQEAAAAQQRELDRMRESLAQVRLAREEEQRQQMAEQQAAAERQRKKEEVEAARRAEAESERRADADYLRAVAAGTRMTARKCPGGEGNYFPVGIRPRISPQRVACIDLEYTASCPGSTARSSGRIANFQGLSTDCFMGDALADHPIQPRPACPVEQVSVRVDAVIPCR